MRFKTKEPRCTRYSAPQDMNVAKAYLISPTNPLILPITEVCDMVKHNFTGFIGLFYGTLALQFEK